MKKADYLDKALRGVLGDSSTNSETLRKLYSKTKLFSIEDIENAWNDGNNNVKPV